MPSQLPLLAELTSPESGTPPTPSPASALSLTLGIDDKIRRKIWDGSFVKFSNLLSSDSDMGKDKYKSVKREGELVFIKNNDRNSITSVTKWMEAFHKFVAIYSEKYPLEIGNLMTYAQTIRKIAETCGDQAALGYDEKFRHWREKDAESCPWEKKNIELYQEAVVMGIEFKSKPKKHYFRPQSKSRYCYSYNNNGFCAKGQSCSYPHVCQYCAGKHPQEILQ
jgi:hypothetical protein